MQSLTHPLTDSVLHHRMRLATHPPSGWLRKPRPDHLWQQMIYQSHNHADRKCGELNVAIRTFWFEDGSVHLGTGGRVLLRVDHAVDLAEKRGTGRGRWKAGS